MDVGKTIEVGPRKCSQLIGLHALSACDTVSYQFGKGNKSALTLLEIDIPGLDQLHLQSGATHAQLKATTDSFFPPLYGQKNCRAMSDARDRFFRGRKKPQPLKKRRLMITCSCTCFELTLRCYFGRQQINWTRQKTFEILPSLVRASTAPSSLRLYNISSCSSSTSGCCELQLHGRGQGMQWHTCIPCSPARTTASAM